MGFQAQGVKMKWPKSEEFSDFHTQSFGVRTCPFKAPQAPYAKMGTLSRRSAATDGEEPLLLRMSPCYFERARRDLSNGTLNVR